MFGAIADRWRTRFGAAAIDRLRDALLRAIEPLKPLLDGLPILGYGLYTRPPTPNTKRRAAARPAIPHAISPSTPEAARPLAERSLSALLSQLLLTSALEYERDPGLSLAIAGNVLRVLNPDGHPFRDLPRLIGVSKESISIALGFLDKQASSASSRSRPRAARRSSG